MIWKKKNQRTRPRSRSLSKPEPQDRQQMMHQSLQPPTIRTTDGVEGPSGCAPGEAIDRSKGRALLNMTSVIGQQLCPPHCQRGRPPKDCHTNCDVYRSRTRQKSPQNKLRRTMGTWPHSISRLQSRNPKSSSRKGKPSSFTPSGQSHLKRAIARFGRALYI